MGTQGGDTYTKVRQKQEFARNDAGRLRKAKADLHDLKMSNASLKRANKELRKVNAELKEGNKTPIKLERQRLTVEKRRLAESVAAAVGEAKAYKAQGNLMHAQMIEIKKRLRVTYGAEAAQVVNDVMNSKLVDGEFVHVGVKR